MKKTETIDDYIADFPQEAQARLECIREIVRKLAPEATEAIKYGLPTFVLNGNLVHFGGFNSHIGFYPTPMGIEEFEQELSKYKQGKGSVQFPLSEPLPIDLIERIVKFRIEKNLAKKK